ncbi:MAG TPA: glycosyltransferase family 4 protein [Elusimicrobiota bacterium]|nr:glycosyltransferase family 4 protein [Elusimicrobiota bacterium]
MTRLLYILPGLVPPGPDTAYDKFTYLSDVAEGVVLLPVWWRSRLNAPAYIESTFPIYRVGNFSYHFFLPFRYPKPVQRLAMFAFYVRRGLQLHRIKKFDVIIIYGTNVPGLAALLLKWLTGAKLIAEIPGVPEDAFRYEHPSAGRSSSLKRFLANQCLLAVGFSADTLKLLYPWQLQAFRSLQKKKAAVFHDFVPVRAIRPSPSSELFILSVGHPWFRKGIDILIQAFKSIAPSYPDYRLKLLGFYTGAERLGDLARGYPQIEFLEARPFEQAIGVIGRCSIYVLASRSEAMGRVLLEAMAARKPIIASAVNGVPHYIRDNENGLLFQSGNVKDLATKLERLMSDANLRERLAQYAYANVRSHYDEQSYVRSFREMLDRARDPRV